MHILVVSHLWPHSLNPSFGIFVQDWARAHVARGHRVDILVLRPQWIQPLARLGPRFGRCFTLPGCIVAEAVVPVLPGAPLALSTWEAAVDSALQAIRLEFRKQEWDRVYAHALLPSGQIAAQLGRITGIPSWITLHGADVFRALRAGDDERVETGRRLSAFDRIVLVSTRLQKAFGSVFPDLDSAVVLNGGADSPPLRIPRQNSRIAYAGRLVPGKGVAELVRAWPLLRKVGFTHLRIVGGGPLMPELRRKVHQQGLENVSLLGRVSHAEMLLELASAAMVVLPSQQEAFNIVAAEAMSQNTPVAMTRGEGLTQDLPPGTIIELDKTDPARLAETLNMWPISARRALGHHAGGIARELLTWERNAHVTEALDQILRSGTHF